MNLHVDMSKLSSCSSVIGCNLVVSSRKKKKKQDAGAVWLFGSLVPEKARPMGWDDGVLVSFNVRVPTMEYTRQQSDRETSLGIQNDLPISCKKCTHRFCKQG